jgi:hypothetical protein
MKSNVINKYLSKETKTGNEKSESMSEQAKEYKLCKVDMLIGKSKRK